MFVDDIEDALKSVFGIASGILVIIFLIQELSFSGGYVNIIISLFVIFVFLGLFKTLFSS